MVSNLKTLIIVHNLLFILVINNSYLKFGDRIEFLCAPQRINWVQFKNELEKGPAVACTIANFLNAYNLAFNFQNRPDQYRLLENMRPFAPSPIYTIIMNLLGLFISLFAKSEG